MWREEKAGPGCLTLAQRLGREEVLSSPKGFVMPAALHVVMGWSHLLPACRRFLFTFRAAPRRWCPVLSWGLGEAVGEVTGPAPGPSPSSLCCVRVSSHSPVPWAWCKTTGDPTESPVLAVLGQETRGDNPAGTGFSVEQHRGGVGVTVLGGFVIQHSPTSVC